MTTLSCHILTLIITIEKLPNFPAEELIHKSKLKLLFGISESTYKRRVADGTLKPRVFCGQDYYYRSDINKELELSKDKGVLNKETTMESSKNNGDPTMYCPNHRRFEPPRCSIEGCRYDVEGDLWDNAPQSHSIEDILPDIEEDQ